MDKFLFLSLLTLNIPAIIFLCIVYSANKKLLNKASVDVAALRKGAKGADQYEVAYLKDGLDEVVPLAFYSLVNNGYLVKINPIAQHKHIPAKEYALNKSMSLDSLHPIERAVVAIYEEHASLPLYKVPGELTEHYEQKMKSLFLFPQSLPCFVNICLFLVWITGVIEFIVLSIQLSLLLHKMHRIDATNWQYYLWIVTLVGILILGTSITIRINHKLKKKCKSNFHEYMESIDKLYLCYPNPKEGTLGKYLENIIWED